MKQVKSCSIWLALPAVVLQSVTAVPALPWVRGTSSASAGAAATLKRGSYCQNKDASEGRVRGVYHSVYHRYTRCVRWRCLPKYCRDGCLQVVYMKKKKLLDSVDDPDDDLYSNREGVDGVCFNWLLARCT